jgi:hypothetical protein
MRRRVALTPIHMLMGTNLLVHIIDESYNDLSYESASTSAKITTKKILKAHSAGSNRLSLTSLILSRAVLC